MDKNIRIRRAEARDAGRIFDFVCWLEESSFDETRFKKIFLENISGEKNILTGEVLHAGMSHGPCN